MPQTSQKQFKACPHCKTCKTKCILASNPTHGCQRCEIKGLECSKEIQDFIKSIPKPGSIESIQQFLETLSGISKPTTNSLDVLDIKTLENLILNQFKLEDETYSIPPLIKVTEMVDRGTRFKYQAFYAVHSDFVIKWLWQMPGLIWALMYVGSNTEYKKGLEEKLKVYLHDLVTHPNKITECKGTVQDVDLLLSRLTTILLFASDLILHARYLEGMIIIRFALWIIRKSNVLHKPLEPEKLGHGITCWSFPDVWIDPWKWIRCESLRRICLQTVHWAFLVSIMSEMEFVVVEEALIHLPLPMKDGLWENLILPMPPKLGPDLYDESLAIACRAKTMEWIKMEGDDRTMTLQRVDIRNGSSFCISFPVLVFASRSYLLQLWKKQGMPDPIAIQSLDKDMTDWYNSLPIEIQQLDSEANVPALLDLSMQWYGKWAGGRIIRHLVMFRGLRIRVKGKVGNFSESDLSPNISWFPKDEIAAQEAMVDAVVLADYATNFLLVLDSGTKSQKEEIEHLMFSLVPAFTKIAILHLNVERILKDTPFVDIAESCHNHAKDIAKLLTRVAHGFPAAVPAKNFVESMLQNPGRSLSFQELAQLAAAVKTMGSL